VDLREFGEVVGRWMSIIPTIHLNAVTLLGNKEEAVATPVEVPQWRVEMGVPKRN
jgi:hypothetical protein